uniref:Uncharacterized protein n=1 Tax=Human betaherpesvirus 6A TaxID=32603 RepID=A0A2L2QE05_9BETA|nr:hypothetical protein [Human betaherpesvirus 6A]
MKLLGLKYFKNVYLPLLIFHLNNGGCYHIRNIFKLLYLKCSISYNLPQQQRALSH